MKQPFVALLLLLTSTTFLSSNLSSVKNFGVGEGLMDEYILDIAQDAHGVLWVAARGSVSNFDGFRWINFSTAFPHEKNIFNEFPNQVKRIVVDRNNAKYFLTTDGTVQYLSQEEVGSVNKTVKTLSYETFSREKFADIQFVSESSGGKVWAATNRSGLYFLLGESWLRFSESEGLLTNRVLGIKSFGEFLAVVTEKGIQIIRNEKVVYTFITDLFSQSDNLSITLSSSSFTKGDIPSIWILVDNSLLKIENEKLTNETFKFFNRVREEYQIVYANGENKLYLAGKGNLKIINPLTNEINLIRSVDGLRGNDPQVIFIDSEKNLWVGTEKGLTQIIMRELAIYDASTGLADNTILSSAQLSNEIFVLGHPNGLVTISVNEHFSNVDLKKKIYRQNLPSEKSDFDVTKILPFTSGSVLLQLGNWGLFELKLNSSVENFLEVKERGEYILSYFIDQPSREIIVSGNFFIDEINKKIIKLGYDKKIKPFDINLPQHDFTSILQSRDGSIWLGTNSPLVYQLSNKETITFNIADNLKSSRITTIKEDRGGNIFIGTDGGLLVIQKSGERKTLTKENGLTGDLVYSLYFDELNNAWIITNFGLGKWNWREFVSPSDWRRFSFNINNTEAVFENQKDIFFVTNNGLIKISKGEPVYISSVPKLYIVDYLIDGKSLSSFKNIEIKTKNNLTIKYNAVLLGGNGWITFQYKLDGYDRDWNEPTTSREVHYTNLPAGGYKFLIRAKSSYSDWSSIVTSKEIAISKYFYETIWFYLGVVLIVVLIVYVAVNYFNKNLFHERVNNLVKKKTENLENANRMLRIEANKVLRSNKLKANFLANMSHEIRTPVNAIIGFADILNDKSLPLSNSERAKYLNYINLSSRRLLILINDILDLSKIEAGTIEFDKTYLSINSEVHESIELFRDRIQSQGLELVLELDEMEEQIYVDKNRLQQILSNLISNAMKFTRQGYIKISSEVKNGKVELIIEDTGIGISKEELPLIFDDFRRASSAVEKSIEGTGLGLSISKKLITMMGGEIYAESELNVGSKFIILFPVAKKSEKVRPTAKDTPGK
jgi:signal transduction histidine kinase/ligand-binding sensor domain-containing protein